MSSSSPSSGCGCAVAVFIFVLCIVFITKPEQERGTFIKDLRRFCDGIAAEWSEAGEDAEEPSDE